MGTRITSKFSVSNWDENPFDEHADAAKLTTARVTRSYTGQIEGDSVTEWLMAYAPDGSARFNGLERFTGTVAGRSGTMVLLHLGSYKDGAATAELTVLPDCGTGELTGVTGAGDFRADPAGTVNLELALA